MESLPAMDTKLNPEIKIPIEQISINYTETPLGLGYGSINAPETSTEEAEMRANNLKEHFVLVDKKSPSDCIDGRYALRLLDGSSLEAPRPGVAGGAGVTGFASAELTRYFGENNLAVQDKFSRIVERLQDDSGNSQVIVVGGHVDVDAVDSEFAEGKTGCGAADKLIANLALLSTVNVTYTDAHGNSVTETDEDVANRIQAVRDLTKAVSEEAQYYSSVDFDSIIDELIHTATEITSQAKLDGWSGSIMKDNIADYGDDRLVVLDTSAGGVHGHTERKVLFNFIENATFDQDSYFDKTLAEEGVGREIFDVDVWHIRDIANKLSNSPDEKQAAKLFTAGVAFQIGTYLGLCDGSHRAYFSKLAE